MNRTEALTAASVNVERTYYAIGGATPGARVALQDGYGYCLCDFEHPVCNFAIVREMSPAVGVELAQLARQRRAMNVYVLPDSKLDSAKLLRQAGFRRHYRMAVMEARGDALSGGIQLHPAVSRAERRVVAEFMVDCFFDRQPHDVRNRISEATALAPCPLLEVRAGGRAVGALLLHEAAGVLGLYNLCVDPRWRRMGYGAGAVRATLERAHETGVSVTLQCDRALVPWYQNLGFQNIGLLDTYSLGRG